MINLDADTEWDIAASVMAQPSLLSRVLRYAGAADFYDVGASKVFDAICALHARGKAPDHLSVLHEMRARGTDPHLMLTAMDADRHRTTPDAAVHFAKRVRAASLARRLRSFGSALAESQPQGDDPMVWIGEAEAELARIGDEAQLGRATGVDDVISSLMDEIDRNARYPVAQPLHLPRLAVILDGGLWPGRLYVIGARPGVGKTALACNVALRALQRGQRVLFASVEMTPEEIMVRLLSDAFDISAQEVRKAERFVELAEVAARWPLEMLGAPLGTAEISHRARELSPELALVVVDYLQILTPATRRDNRATEVGEMSRDLKIMAQQLGVPVVACAQLNREVEGRRDPIPRMSDLRESGSIENDADVVLLLHRDIIKEPYVAEGIVAKNRHGAAGHVDLRFYPRFSRFVEEVKL